MANETIHHDFWNSLRCGWNNLRRGLSLPRAQLATSIRAQLATLIRRGNRRQLVLRNAEGAMLLRLPLTLAVVVGLLLLWQAAPLLLGAFILALLFRVQFLITSELEQITTDLSDAK